MTRSIYELVQKGQRVLVQGQKNSYVVTSVFKPTVLRANIQKTSTPLAFPSLLVKNRITSKLITKPVSVVVKTSALRDVYEDEVALYEFDCVSEIHDIFDQCMKLSTTALTSA